MNNVVNEMIMKQPYGVRRYCLFTVVVYVSLHTVRLPVKTWRGGECKGTEIRHERPHASVPPAQSEKSWSCDWSCCRVDCGGGTDAEGGDPCAGPLLWFAASARSCRNLSKSERHSSKCCQHKSKQEMSGRFVSPVLEKKREESTFTGHPLAHGRLFLLCVQTQHQTIIFFTYNKAWEDTCHLTASHANHLSMSFVTEFFTGTV